MQRLNVLTLAAFLLGVCAFIFDATSRREAPLMAEMPVWDSAPFESAADLTGMPAGLD